MTGAHKIAEMRDDSPLVTVALHRLLLAILHRCYQGPKKPADRVAIRKAGCSTPTVSTRYFAEVGRSVRPVPRTIPVLSAGRIHDQANRAGSTGWLRNYPAATTRRLFDHTTDDPPPALTPRQRRPCRGRRAGVRGRRRQERHRQHHTRPARLRGGGPRPGRHPIRDPVAEPHDLLGQGTESPALRVTPPSGNASPVEPHEAARPPAGLPRLPDLAEPDAPVAPGGRERSSHRPPGVLCPGTEARNRGQDSTTR